MTDKDDTWEGAEDIICDSLEGDGINYTFEKSRSGGFNKRKTTQKERENIIKNIVIR